MNTQTTKSVGSSALRSIHKRKILFYIQKNGPVSRKLMCKELGISASTASRVVEELINENIVVETGAIKTSVGRSIMKLEINPSSKYCFGINLSRNTLGIALVDAAMNVQEKLVTSIAHIDSADALLSRIGDTVQSMIDSKGIEPEKILGMGVGSPGVVDPQGGIVKNFGMGRFINIPIKQYLTERFNLNVIVDNNANTRMLGEFWNGYAYQCSNAMFVINSEGVGSGILYHGSILSDVNSTTGGFGHISVDFNGPECKCGNRGCVELYCGTENIERQAIEQIEGAGRDSGVYSDLEYQTIDYRLLSSLVDGGDTRFTAIFDRAAEAMSTALASVINIICPEVVILSGTLFDASEYYYNAVMDKTLTKIGFIAAKPVFKRRFVKDEIYEIGAAALILSDFFTD
jgi:predicted NBD/HSP70 family sugar kinase